MRFRIDLSAPSWYTVLGLTPECSVREIRATQSRIIGDLTRKLTGAGTPEEKRTLSERQIEINRVGGELSNPTTRAAYDRENAHLSFFVVRKAAAPVFEDREAGLYWMHRIAQDFLTREGVSLQPITDLGRTDFSADRTPNPLLDRLLASARARGGPLE